MERFIDINGTKIWTISEGQGLPLIICNGGPGCDDYLQPISAMLENQCQVIRWEPRGCGRSDYDGRYDLVTTVQDLEIYQTGPINWRKSFCSVILLDQI